MEWPSNPAPPRGFRTGMIAWAKAAGALCNAKCCLHNPLQPSRECTPQLKQNIESSERNILLIQKHIVDEVHSFGLLHEKNNRIVNYFFFFLHPLPPFEQ